MLIIRCPRCKKNNTKMFHFWDEYLCKECLKTERKPLYKRQSEEFNERQKNNKALNANRAKMENVSTEYGQD